MNSGTWSVVLLALLAPPQKEFHQGVAYRIEARLDEQSHVLTGRARLLYTNRSPDRLDTLYFHLHLNAFRPNSAWAQREAQFNNRRFQDLGPNDHAFDRITSIRVDGTAVKPVFPFAPDSTVMAVPLQKKLAPNAVATVAIDWTSRLSATATRRQGRKDRHYDFAHGYPRIAVYDTAGWQVQTLLPQGEFFGEFASYDVTLDVAADQVVAATGVPVSGDPGWERVNRTQEKAPVLQRTAYGELPAASLGLLGALQDGRKRIRWRAEQVHHFAWSTDPNYVYEGDRSGNVALHALFLPTDTIWPGSVIRTMKQALAFYDSVLGPYAYPQLTAAWRIDRGATEFPMFTTHSTPPAVVHETGHEWAHAILANNEFKEGWLDEGLVSFLGFMYNEARGNRPNYERGVSSVARYDSAGVSQPLGWPAARFSNFNLYQVMTYTKPSLVLRMLRYHVGDDAFRRGLKLYYEKNKLQHVDENDFRGAMELAAGTKLDWFFDQFFRTTATLDYAVTAVQAEPKDTGWRTRVEITRAGDIWMPFDLKVGERVTRIDSRERKFSVFVDTQEKPAEVVIDPEYVLLDIARSNNRSAIN